MGGKKMKALKRITLFLFCCFLIIACKEKTGQPYPKQTEESWSRNACGAFSSAYYLAESGQISGSEIKSFAKDFYSTIKFDASAGFGEYSDPFKIMKEISPYASSVTFKMNKANPQQDAEKLLTSFFRGMNTTGITNIDSIEAGLQKNEYVIEIVISNERVNLSSSMRNPLHYVLTYWKGDTLYTLDPMLGKEVPRENLINGKAAKYCFTNGGIFLIP